MLRIPHGYKGYLSHVRERGERVLRIPHGYLWAKMTSNGNLYGIFYFFFTRHLLG